MSLYYVKRVRIPRGPERLRGLYAGARPSYFHSATPTTAVTQLPPQIPGGNADLLVAQPSSAAGGGSVPLPCPFPEPNTESTTVTLVPRTPPTEIPSPGGTIECSAPSPQSAERNPSVAHASSLAGEGSVSLPLPQQVPESKIENLSSEISSFPSSSLPSLPSVQASLPVFISQRTLAQTNPNTPKPIENLNPEMSSLPCSPSPQLPQLPQLPPVNVPLFHSRKFASIRGCSSNGNTQKTQPQNTPVMPVFIAQNTLTQLIPGGNLGRSPASSLPGTEPTEIPRPGGAAECSAPSPQPAERNPSVAHASSLPLPHQAPESKVENLSSEITSFPSSSLPSLPSVRASLPVFISQRPLAQTNPNTPKPTENQNSKMSSLPCSPLSQLPQLPPVNVPFLHSRNLAFIGGFSPDRTGFTPSKKVYSQCIAGALYTRAAKSTFGWSSMSPANLSSCDTYDSIHPSVLPTNLAKNARCTNSAPPPSNRHQDRTAHLARVLRTVPGGSAESSAASSPPGTRPTETSCSNGAIEADSPRYLHHLQPLGTAISCVEISNSELLASSLPSLPSVQALLPVFISQRTLAQTNPNIPKPIANLNSKMSSPPCSPLSQLPQLPPVNVPFLHSCNLPFIDGFSPDRTGFTPSKKVYSRCMVGALYPRAAKSTFGLSSMSPANLSSCDTYASIHPSVLPTNLAKNPGCTNSAPPPSNRHQDRTAHLARVLRTIPGGSADLLVAPPSSAAGGGSVPLPCPFPGGNIESSTVTLVPCTPPTEIPRPVGTVECSAPSPQSAERNPSVAHASSLAGGGSVSLPLPQQVPESKIENLNPKISSLPCSSFPRFPQLPPVNVPFLPSRPVASSPLFLQTAPAKAVSKKCIFGAVPKSGNPSRKHRKDTVSNTPRSPVFIDQNTAHSQNTEPVLRQFFTHRTKPHHPHPLRTGSSCAEAPNSEQLASPLALFPQLPPVNVPLFNSHPFASIRGCSSAGNKKKHSPKTHLPWPSLLIKTQLHR
jgi:hypothetical protein